MNRVQKLLMEDYSEFNENVLIESSFAQITENGTGIRQVQIALTRTKLIIGGDRFDKTATKNLTNIYYKKIDPEIESMEVIAILPLELIYIKLFRRVNRQIMKVIVGNNMKIMYFEFGGHLLRNLSWNMWRDRITALRRIQNNSYNTFVNHYDTSLTSASEYELPKKIEVMAQIHLRRQYGNSENSLENIDDGSEENDEYIDSEPSKENSTFWTNFKNFPNYMGKFFKRTKSRLSIHSGFLKTQSETVIKKERDINNCCEIFKDNQQKKSTSVDNIYSDCFVEKW